MSEQFLWGAATSSHQIEGSNRHNDWWAWEAKGHVEGGARSGLATDHLHRFREDIAMARAMGLNSYRFSFEWSRFEPEEGVWNSEAFDWYRELLAECERAGLVPMATLHHFTIPNWLAERGGLASDEAPKFFSRYASRIAKAFAACIPLWCTVNEPVVLATGAYLGGFMPPATFEPQKASQAWFNLLKWHVLAYDILHSESSRREGAFRAHPFGVGFAHNLLDFRAERKWHPVDVTIARVFRRLYNDSWLQAVNGEKHGFGLPWVIPFAPQLESVRGRRTFDFIGVNYYTRAYVQWRPRSKTQESIPQVPIGINFARRKERASDLGWAVHPRGLGRVLESLRRFQAPIFITENGIADASDDLRGPYLLSHLGEVARARARGLDIRGYYHWSLIDNFEWIKGFWPRFGLVAVDYETMERVPRPSAGLYRELIEAHGRDGPPDESVLKSFLRVKASH